MCLSQGLSFAAIRSRARVAAGGRGRLGPFGLDGSFLRRELATRDRARSACGDRYNNNKNGLATYSRVSLLPAARKRRSASTATRNARSRRCSARTSRYCASPVRFPSVQRRYRTRTIEISHDSHSQWDFRTLFDRPNRTGNNRDTSEIRNAKIPPSHVAVLRVTGTSPPFFPSFFLLCFFASHVTPLSVQEASAHAARPRSGPCATDTGSAQACRPRTRCANSSKRSSDSTTKLEIKWTLSSVSSPARFAAEGRGA